MGDLPQARDVPALVVVAVVTGPDGVLVVRRRGGTPPWVFPGGKVEHGETPATAARREVLEETGVDATITGELGRRVQPVTGASMIYVAATARASTTEMSDAAVAEVRWTPLHALSALILSEQIFPPVLRHLMG